MRCRRAAGLEGNAILNAQVCVCVSLSQSTGTQERPSICHQLIDDADISFFKVDKPTLCLQKPGALDDGFTGVISALMCLKATGALTKVAFNPVWYLDMGKSFASSYLG